MSYYRRGYAWEILEYLQAPTGGWNPETPASELPTNQAQALDNFLLRPGKIVCRGGFDIYGDFSAYAPLNAGGVVMGTPDWILIGRKVVSAAQSIDPWNAHIQQQVGGAGLAQGSTTALWKAGGGAVQTLTLTRDQIPGPRWINYNGLLFGYSYDATGALLPVSIAGYSVRPTQLLNMPAAQTVPTVPSASPGPKAGIDIKDYYGRLFVLGGTDIQDAANLVYTTKLYFTNPTITLFGGLSDWKDPVSGNTNFMAMDYNTSDPGVALSRTRSGLVIHRQWSTWILRGTSPNTFQLQIVSKEYGCIDARSVCETDHGVYFMSHKGLMLTDGFTIRNVSGPLQHTLLNAIAIYQVYVRNGFGGYCSCRLTSTGDVMVSVGVATSAGGSPTGGITPIWSAMFDTAANAWARITSPIWGLDGALDPIYMYSGLLVGTPGNNSRMFALGDRYQTRMEDLPASKSFIRTPGLFDKMPDGTFAPIPALWRSRLTHGTDPRKKMQIKRMFADYVFQGLAIPAAGWTVTPVDAAGNLLTGASAFTTPALAGATSSSVAGGLPIANPSLQHSNLDLAVEAVDAGVIVTWSAPTQVADGSLIVPEVHGVGFEQQPTSDRRP